MRETQTGPDEFFFAHRAGANVSAPLAGALEGYERVQSDHDYWSDDAPQSMLIDEVEAIWSAIAEHDDWQPLAHKVEDIRRMGEALGEPPSPAGHDPAVLVRSTS